MLITQTNFSGQSKFYMSLVKLTNSYRKRGVSFGIHAHSEFVANLTIVVTGKYGTGQKDIVVLYNDVTKNWEAYSQGYKYDMTSLSELSTLIKTRIAKLNTVLSKI